MLAVQHQLAFARPLAYRRRSLRRPFRPAQHPAAVYRLPHDIQDRLATALTGFKNREAAFALAVFIARFWSAPARLTGCFPIDRRELADRADLDLTEARVRGAIKTLEAVGFLERAIPASGSAYRPTEEGLHRKPILFVFGREYAGEFAAANKRPRKPRDAHSAARRDQTAKTAPRPPAANVGDFTPYRPARATQGMAASLPVLNSPKSKTPTGNVVIMGDLVKECGWRQPPFAPDPRLEGALARLEKAFRESREEGGSR